MTKTQLHKKLIAEQKKNNKQLKKIQKKTPLEIPSKPIQDLYELNTKQFIIQFK